MDASGSPSARSVRTIGRHVTRALAAAALAAALSGCPARRRAVRPVTTTGTTETVDALARQALALDAAGDRAADTLYAADAIVVANARIRLRSPRFAGVSYGGRITVAAASVTLEGRFAWVMVDYRWVNPEQRLAEAGRATFVIEQRPSGWKIVHVHSSQTLPWER